MPNGQCLKGRFLCRPGAGRLFGSNRPFTATPRGDTVDHVTLRPPRSASSEALLRPGNFPFRDRRASAETIANGSAGQNSTRFAD